MTKLETTATLSVEVRCVTETQHPSIAVLPQELVDAVVDHSAEDPVTLQALSLVSRRWTRRAQQHLLKTVEVYFGLPSSEEHVQETFRNSPALELVQKLCLHGTSEADALEGVLQMFRHVRALHLVRPFTVPLDLATRFDQLEALSLEGIPFPHIKDLFRLLHSSPQLLSLDLLDICFREFVGDSLTERDLLDYHGCLPRLRALRVQTAIHGRTEEHHVLRYLARMVDARNCTTVELAIQHGENAQELLQVCSPHIQSLKLDDRSRRTGDGKHAAQHFSLRLTSSCSFHIQHHTTHDLLNTPRPRRRKLSISRRRDFLLP